VKGVYARQATQEDSAAALKASTIAQYGEETKKPEQEPADDAAAKAAAEAEKARKAAEAEAVRKLV
jgi:hypothetical protein